MAETRLILHVKGTETGTQELPKEAVRSGLSQGKITYSQLIWSAADNAWKQAREWPELLPGEQLILHVKGTEAETRQLPKQDVRSAIAHGQITHSQLIWSAADNAWKQVRELPELLPSQKLAPAPPIVRAPMPSADDSPASPVAPATHAVVPKAAVPKASIPQAAAPQAAVPQAIGSHAHPPVALTGAPKPKVRVAGTAAAGPQPKVAGAAKPKVAGAAQAQKPRLAAAGAPSVRAQAVAGRSTGSVTVKEEEDHFHPFKWIFFVLGTVIVVLLLANFFLVSLPLSTKFGRTSFSNVTVFAHLGAFVQPNVMVIHIRPSAEITPENLPDVMVALARSTPANPFTREPFDRVAITSGWTAQYSFSGSSWQALAQLDQGDSQQRKELLLAQMDDAGGQPLITASTLNEAAQEAKREEIWKTFVNQFTTAH